MDGNTRVSEELRGQAATWFAELNEPDISEAQRAAFAQWLLRSPDHIEAFLHVTTVASAVAATAQHPVEHLIREARADSEPQNVVELRREPTRAAKADAQAAAPASGRRWLWLAASVSAAAALLVWLFIGLGPQPLHIRTQAGEQRTLRIADGTVLHVQSDSELTIELKDNRRSIQLERGQARFAVAKDPDRPFIVTTPHATVRAVGTIFDVAAASSRTAVIVLEGRVEVVSVQETAPSTIDATKATASADHGRTQLAAGESATVSRAGDITRDVRLVETTAPAPAVRSLVFREESLAEVIAKFNREGASRIRIADPQLATLAISGAFAADDTESLLEYLRRYHGVEVVETEQDVRLLVRASASR